MACQGVEAVSYTHLDVYKRQHVDRTITIVIQVPHIADLDGAMDSRVTPACAHLSPAGHIYTSGDMLRITALGNWACLLYTSRCV